MEKRALGKGLNALIPEKEEIIGSSADEIPIAKIRPNPFQPREDFDAQSLDELVQSIKEKGVIQPVLVRRHGEDYELIAGERRLRAAQSLNMAKIPAVIKDADDKESLELALIENIQRQSLNPIEEARAYKYLIDKFELTQEKVSEVLGRARASVANTLRLLNLPPEIQEKIKNGALSFAHGKALLEITDEQLQKKIAHEVIARNLSVRELENLLKSRRVRKTKARPCFAGKATLIEVIEEQLQQALATKVRVVKGKKRGVITIEFYSEADLERIANKIKGGN
ncbi:MAG: ParB/RepB/Spo0J family partition protein [Candidatus Omnitrophica bacterium]|jgi:ParB family chromosome partitioning protein|nr:ParB/RepB/Spo0J family partition protein [Candidatus Omnitrophota bacterium]